MRKTITEYTYYINSEIYTKINGTIMNKLLITLFITSISGAAYGMQQENPSTRIQVLSSYELTEQFKAKNHKDFIKHSSLINRVGGKNCDKDGLTFAICSAITQYQWNNKELGENALLILHKDAYAIILQTNGDTTERESLCQSE